MRLMVRGPALARGVSGLGIAGAAALGLLFACADSKSESDPPVDPPAVVPDASAEAAPDTGSFDAGPDVRPVAPGQCSRGGFCYVSLPVLSPIIAISASSMDDAWMLPNDSQSILHWDGTSVKQVYEYAGATPEKVTFGAIWAEKKDSVWAVGTDSTFRFFVVHYASVSGAAPTFRDLPTEEYATNYPPNARVNSVWSTAASDVLWVAGGQSILRFRDDGGAALGVDRFMPTGGPDDRNQYQWYSIWGFADDDIYVGGQGSSPRFGTRGALAHYDGTSWSIRSFDGNEALLSLRGTQPGQPRQLWYSRWRNPDQVATRLAPVSEEGGLGEELFAAGSPACNGRVGAAVTEAAGWFSNGLVVCRWNGTKLEDTATALGARPTVQQVNGIWAGSADDAWIVGASATSTGGFAARRTRETAEGGTP